MNLRLLSAALSLASFAAAADLTLADGRTLRDYTITSQTPTTVMVRHTGGAAKIAKSLLPAPLQKLFPIDAAAAAAEAAANTQGKGRYDEQVRALETKRAEEHAARLERNRPMAEALEKARVDREAQASAAQDAAAAALPGEVKAVAHTRAERYFKTERSPTGNNSTLKFDLKVELEEVRPLTGWPGRYEVVGFGSLQYLTSKGSSFGGDKSWFRVTVQLDQGGIPRVASFDPLNSEPLRL